VTEVLKDRLILFLDELPDHLVVLHGSEPEVGYANLALKVFDIDLLDLFVILVLFLGDDLCVVSFELSEFLSKCSDALCKLSVLTVDNLSSHLV
jgi:hypothetical protein